MPKRKSGPNRIRPNSVRIHREIAGRAVRIEWKENHGLSWPYPSGKIAADLIHEKALKLLAEFGGCKNGDLIHCSDVFTHWTITMCREEQKDQVAEMRKAFAA